MASSAFMIARLDALATKLLTLNPEISKDNTYLVPLIVSPDGSLKLLHIPKTKQKQTLYSFPTSHVLNTRSSNLFEMIDPADKPRDVSCDDQLIGDSNKLIAGGNSPEQLPLLPIAQESYGVSEDNLLSCVDFFNYLKITDLQYLDDTIDKDIVLNVIESILNEIISPFFERFLETFNILDTSFQKHIQNSIETDNVALAEVLTIAASESQTPSELVRNILSAVNMLEFKSINHPFGSKDSKERLLLIHKLTTKLYAKLLPNLYAEHAQTIEEIIRHHTADLENTENNDGSSISAIISVFNIDMLTPLKWHAEVYSRLSSLGDFLYPPNACCSTKDALLVLLSISQALHTNKIELTPYLEKQLNQVIARVEKNIKIEHLLEEALTTLGILETAFTDTSHDEHGSKHLYFIQQISTAVEAYQDTRNAISLTQDINKALCQYPPEKYDISSYLIAFADALVRIITFNNIQGFFEHSHETKMNMTYDKTRRELIDQVYAMLSDDAINCLIS